MGVFHINHVDPKTKFAPVLHVPCFKITDGSDALINALKLQVLELEKQITTEELVSEVPKMGVDPYPYTQHWKQHTLFWDRSALDGEHLERFVMTTEFEKLFHLIRKQYLLFLKELNYPRVKVYIHGWANVLREGQWISKHYHQDDEVAYVSGTYYLTTVPTHLDLINPLRTNFKDSIPTTKGTMLFFPSYIPHESTVYHGDDVRISIAFDIVVESCIRSNPWRPHVLFDDPDTMDGFEMYLKDRSLTSY